MQLGRYQVSTLRPPPILAVDFSLDGRLFAVALKTGYEVWRTYPLALIRRRSSLGRALPLPNSPLLALQGGGKSPLFAPNKVILYHDGLGVAVAELEFGEKVRGLTCRASTLCIALSRRVIAFQYGVSAPPDPSGKGKGKAKESDGGFFVTKIGEWETVTNERGLMAVASTLDSTLLAIPGRQTGHVQLIHLPACRPPNSTAPSRTTRSASQAFRSPIILAHEHELSSLACTATGSHIITTSERGTLLRVWSTSQGRLERELRRGVDRAEMWGAQFEDAVSGKMGQKGAMTEERRRDELRSKGGRVVGWSDKGTVHVWGNADDESRQDGTKSSTPVPSLTNILSRNLPLPKYFSSSPSTALYRLPRKNPHAFASTVSAAAEAAYLPSMKMREAGEEEGEWNERFVVCWVGVEVDVAEIKREEKARPAGTSRTASMDMGIGMGTREERRSFGSDATTSRTATPTLGLGRDPPSGIPTLLRKQSTASTRAEQRPLPSMTRRDSLLSRDPKVRASGPIPKGAGEPRRTKMERQLIAITFGGDWYRLRIPDDTVEDAEGEIQKKTGRKCELVEYRRLNVGGGGW